MNANLPLFGDVERQLGRFARFGESFVEFFRMISLSAVRHPLVSNDNSRIGLVAVTSEAGFMGDLNAKLIRYVLAEKEKYADSVLITVGKKGAERLRPRAPVRTG